MKGKRGIELSMNFIVVLIISIVVFAFGIRFIYKLVSDTNDFAGMTFDQLDDAISSLICGSSDRVCITGDQKEVRRDQIAVFGIKIMNVLDSQNFNIIVTRPSPGGYTKNNKEIFGDKIDWKPKIRSVYIASNEEMKVGVGIYVPKTAVSGDYIFNVDIRSQDGSPYSNMQKFYVNMP